MSMDEWLDKFQIMRRERIRMFDGILRERKKVDKEFFIAEMSSLFGITEKLAKDYLKVLKILKKIDIKNGEIIHCSSDNSASTNP